MPIMPVSVWHFSSFDIDHDRGFLWKIFLILQVFDAVILLLQKNDDSSVFF